MKTLDLIRDGHESEVICFYADMDYGYDYMTMNKKKAYNHTYKISKF